MDYEEENKKHTEEKAANISLKILYIPILKGKDML